MSSSSYLSQVSDLPFHSFSSTTLLVLLCLCAVNDCEAECSDVFTVVDSTPPTIYGTRPTIEGSTQSTGGNFLVAPTLVTLWCVACMAKQIYTNKKLYTFNTQPSTLRCSGAAAHV